MGALPWLWALQDPEKTLVYVHSVRAHLFPRLPLWQLQFISIGQGEGVLVARLNGTSYEVNIKPKKLRSHGKDCRAPAKHPLAIANSIDCTLKLVRIRPIR